MATIREMLNRWKSINLNKITGDAMSKNDDKIAELNREQLNEGYKADGTPIRPKYKPYTIAIKQQKGQRWDVVTLRDTGSFQDKIKLSVDGSKFDLDSTDSKKTDLELKYGTILGLTESGKKEAWVICKPDVVQDIKNITGCE